MTRAATALRWALGLLLIAMVLLNVANAAGRYLAGRAIAGSDEILVFSMVWLVFLGLILVTAQDRHLRFDLLDSVLGPRLGRLRAALIFALIAGLSVYVALQSWEVLSRLGRIDQRSMAAGIPMVVPHTALLVGLGLTAVTSVVLAVRHFLAALGRDPGTAR